MMSKAGLDPGPGMGSLEASSCSCYSQTDILKRHLVLRLKIKNRAYLTRPWEKQTSSSELLNKPSPFGLPQSS